MPGRRCVRPSRLAVRSTRPRPWPRPSGCWKNAKANQSKGEFRVAREEAEQARDKAMAALREAEAAKASKPEP